MTKVPVYGYQLCLRVKCIRQVRWLPLVHPEVVFELEHLYNAPVRDVRGLDGYAYPIVDHITHGKEGWNLLAMSTKSTSTTRLTYVNGI